MVSVAMATYNGAQFILKQLDSILSQSYSVDEVIICDDNSNDNTVELIRAFIKEKNLSTWQVYVNTKNVGYVSNFHRAICLTHGDYVFLSDQDDIWLPNKVDEMLKIFKSNSQILYLHTQISIIDNLDNIIAEKFLPLHNDLCIIPFSQFLKRLNYCGMSSAFSAKIREAFKKVNPMDIPTHDWFLCGIASIQNGFYTYNRIYTLRRYHQNNVALNLNKHKQRTINERIELILQYKQYYLSLEQYLLCLKGLPKQYKVKLHKSILLCNKRMELFEQCSKFRFFLLLKNISHYPSIKAFVCDVLTAFNIFKYVKYFRRK